MGGSNGMIDAGNLSVAAPYTISGKTGALAPAGGSAYATLINFGMRSPALAPNVLLPTPIRIAQIRMKWAAQTAAATAGIAFEIHQGLATIQHTVGGTLRAPRRRKTSGYPPILTTETSLFMTTAATAVSGGDFAPLDAGAPFDMMTMGSDSGLSGGEAIWTLSDTMPLTLEPGEALEVRAVNTNTGTGILFLAIDFFR